MNITTKKLPKSEIEISITVDAKTFETYHDKGFKAVQEMVELDGFRKGNAPENLIVQKYGDMIILEEMANLALREAYIKAIDEHKIAPISDPKVTINKLAKGNPLEITMTVPVMPEVILPKYKKVAEDAGKGHDVEEVTDKDIEDVINELAKGRAHQHSQEHDHVHDENGHHPSHDVPVTDEETATLPVIDDVFAQSFGEDFKTLTDLQSKIKENLVLEKKQKTKEKKRTAIVEALITETKADVPDALIAMELERMLAQMKADITRFGGTWEDYLKHTKKTEEEIKKTWEQDALKRTMSQLVLAEIALAEKIVPTEEEIQVELVRLLATVQDADEERAKTYLHQALTNEKVLSFLEGEK